MKPVFTTLTSPPDQRVDLWQDFVSRSCVPIEVGDFEPAGFGAHIDTVRLGEIDVSHFTGAEQSIRRPRHIISSSDADMFAAVIQLSGAMSYAQGNEEGSQITGSVTLFDMTRDYYSMFHNNMDFIDVSIPRKLVEALLGPTRNLAGLTIGPDEPLTSLIIAFFRNQTKLAEGLSPEAACRLGAIGADLLATGFLEKIGHMPGQRLGNAAAMARAKAFVRGNLADSELSPQMVAASGNMSLRRMQELFAEERLTIADYIWEQRLLHAKKRLESRAFDRLPIADVGASAGFTSLPHFSRRFRSRFGYGPGECRRRAARGAKGTVVF